MIEFKAMPFLLETFEEEENEITFVVSLPVTGEKGTDLEEAPPVKELLSDARPVYPDEENRYKITFRDYILYQVRNESYTVFDDYEVRKGKYFFIYERSRLLDALPQFVSAELVKALSPDGYAHYEICCQNHVVDVIAPAEPVVEKG